MAEEGFVHKGQRVYSLLYRLECPPPRIMELVVPLDSDGNAIGPTCIPGEKIFHNGTEYTVKAVEVFRSLPLDPPGILPG